MTNNKLFKFDNSFDTGFLIGTDEAGRGPGAGGVFAAAVCFNNITLELIEKLSDLNDSKRLSKKKREELYDIIFENTINSTVCIEVEEIEKINILQASLKAMRLACENVIGEIANGKWKMENGKLLLRGINQNDLCSCTTFSNYPSLAEGSKSLISGKGIVEVVWASAHQKQEILILIDGNKTIKNLNHSTFRPLDPSTTMHQRCIVKGDGKSASIAAASILAKVSRDRYMQELHEKFPQYNWKQNAGYLTAEHLSAIDKYGVTPYHRRSFLKKHEEKCNINQLSLYQK